MRVLADYHHHALAASLGYLFEDRYGADLYFPVGMEWFDFGVWQFEKAWHGDRVARQYLVGVWDGAEPDADGIVTVTDRKTLRQRRGITYAAACEMPWDIVISTLPPNDPGYWAIAQRCGARFGVQVGNEGQASRWDLASFILASSTLPGHITPDDWARPITWQGTPTVIYHQEFDLDWFRAEWPPANRREVASWVNCFPEGPSYPEFAAFARAHADEFEWRVYGAYGNGAADEFQAGDINATPEVAERMRGARVGWHSKHWSDGFGHTVHNWFAIGRPVIGYEGYYRDKLAGALWQEGVTSFALERHAPDEVLGILRRLRDDDDYHRTICEASAARFRELVDFDREAEVIGQMLGLAVPA